jgi:heme iron utilization protein
MTTRGDEARRLLRRFRAGVLSTHSAKHPGYPYGAALPFATDARGAIVVLISHLAEHTQNLQQDARVSFTVSPLAAGFQSEQRLSVLGDAAVIDEAASAERYLRIHPEGQQHLEIGGFRFYRVEPRHARLISGFGSLHWIEGPNLLAPQLPIAQAEADVLRHMNAEHPHNLVDYCRHVHGMQAKNAQMCGIDCDGFDVRADGILLRFDFSGLIEDAEQARRELVSLARASRAP